MKKIALLGLVMLFGCSQESDPQGCTSRGDSCSDSYECCGTDVCDGWQCVADSPVCSATGYGCVGHADCCNYDQGTGWCVDGICKDSCYVGGDCVSGCCAPTSIANVSTCADASYCACLPVRSYCTNAAQCCGAMLCENSVGSLICCSQYGMGCIYDNDCCGVMLCYGGVCG